MYNITNVVKQKLNYIDNIKPSEHTYTYCGKCFYIQNINYKSIRARITKFTVQQ